jgi:hypothetical protein
MNSQTIRFFAAFTIVAGFATPFVASSLTAAPPNMDKWVGTWILNGQKSQYGDGKPPVDPSLLRQILKIHVTNGILDLYIRTETADGTDVGDETHLLDLTGKPHATEIGGLKAVAETFRELDPNTIEIVLTARPTDDSDVGQGELTIRVRFKMSADRKTISETKEYHYKELAPSGRAAPNGDLNPAEGSVLVFDRQSAN